MSNYCDKGHWERGMTTPCKQCEIERLTAERDKYEKYVCEILCRIHRDGGHYITEHGLEKAMQDADEIAANLNAERDALAAQVVAMKEFARHKKFCRILDYNDDRDDCTCGLDALNTKQAESLLREREVQAITWAVDQYAKHDSSQGNVEAFFRLLAAERRNGK